MSKGDWWKTEKKIPLSGDMVERHEMLARRIDEDEIEVLYFITVHEPDGRIVMRKMQGINIPEPLLWKVIDG